MEQYANLNFWLSKWLLLTRLDLRAPASLSFQYSYEIRQFGFGGQAAAITVVV